MPPLQLLPVTGPELTSESAASSSQASDEYAEDPEFLETYLNSPPGDALQATSEVKGLLDAITSAEGAEEDIYQPYATLLTNLSQRTYGASLDHRDPHISAAVADGILDLRRSSA